MVSRLSNQPRPVKIPANLDGAAAEAYAIDHRSPKGIPANLDGAAAEAWVMDHQRGAGKRIKLLNSDLVESLGMKKGFRLPAGFTVSKTEIKSESTRRLPDGSSAKLTFAHDRLNALGPDGKTVEFGAAEHQKQLATLTKGFMRNDNAVTDFNETQGYAGFGAAGKAMSVVTSRYAEEGALQPTEEVKLETFNAATGQKLKLKDVLSARQIADLTASVRAAVQSITDDTQGDFVANAARIPEQIQNFGVSTNVNGDISLTVAVEMLPVEGPGPGSIAKLTFAAPADAQIRRALGLDQN